ncbi:MAG: DUF2254 domain-containing protein [Deltaproteobacteria bacterium]|nr:DUF2254 domain-containing protein [Deltaproteobacteria bacterium]
MKALDNLEKGTALGEAEEKGGFVAMWVVPMGLIMGLGLVMFMATALLDMPEGMTLGSLLEDMLRGDFDASTSAVGQLPQVLIGILGLTLTVSAIVVQLAAQRYTPKLVDLFLADRVNILSILAMVLASVYSSWILYSARENFVHWWGNLTLTIITSLLLALLIPYFQYVFQFLTPSNILSNIEGTQNAKIQKASQTHGGQSLEKAKNHMANSMEQVSDIALSSVNQLDRNVALMSIDTLCLMIRKYIPMKEKMDPAWFVPHSHHFISISSEYLIEIHDRKIWVETRGFMNLELLFNQSLKGMPDAVSAIALNTRHIATTARDNGDYETLYLCLEYFNTYIRRAVNDRNQRAVFTMFYQYRRLAEELLASYPKLSEEIATFLQYYGQESIRGGIPFLMLVAAMDIGTLLENGFRQKTGGLDTLLNNFLAMSSSEDVRKVAFVHKGVRKAQVILAAYLMSTGNHKDALETIHQSLKTEKPEWLTEVRTELLAVNKKKFWEVTDRGGINFEYMEPAMKEWLKTFYKEYLEKNG